MSGEIFFDFGVKPIKKRKSQIRENQQESSERERTDRDSTEIRGEKNKHHIWKRTDYAKASAADMASFYGGGRTDGIDQPATRMKLRLSRKPRRKSKHLQRTREKERKGRKSGRREEELMSSLSEREKGVVVDEKERKKRKKRRKKRSDELSDDVYANKTGRQWWKTKKRRSFRQKGANGKTDDVGMRSGGGERMSASVPLADTTSQSPSPSLVEETTKTALCAPSMVLNCEFSHYEFRVLAHIRHSY
ncbi:unnamed protein product [Litomosoides sigmodontis]|uniref:Uncharacterized protein n=1 Tax=Litomosoides sigmodontis TaxID=42156 RepID=A0A3P7M120_LITSI|nr:unnamed protein product [Litomosoides sigmodontis]